MTTTCIVWWLLLPLAVVAATIHWLTESRAPRIRRWRRQGLTWAAIGTRLNCSPSTARRWATA
jgi:IS30 family transposase